MSNFILTVFKGLYPIYLCFFVLGVLHRIIERKWIVFDTILLVSFVVFELLASFQIMLFYGLPTTSKRYLWIGLPLYLPFVADGLLWGKGLLESKKFHFSVFTVLCIVIGGVNLYNIYSPVLHEKYSIKKSTERKNSRDAALWISNDWGNGDSLDLNIFKCDQYQSGKHPLVKSEFERIGYLCGGQNYPAFFAVRNIMPDYIVSQLPVELPDYVLVYGNNQFHIYKYRKIQL